TLDRLLVELCGPGAGGAAPDGMAVAPEVCAGVMAAAARLQAAGYAVEEVAVPPLRRAAELQLQLWLAEMRRTGGAAIAAEGDPDAVFVYEGLSRHAPAVDLAGFMDVLQARAGLVRAWRDFFDRWPVLLCPVSGLPPFADHRDVASEADFDAVLAAQLPMVGLPFMGLPGLSVTTGAGRDAGGPVPVGVQLVADRFREDLLLEAGAVLAGTVAPVTPGGSAA
ncbi:MAG: amidase family protein, partial [Gemmobacter sp.]